MGRIDLVTLQFFYYDVCLEFAIASTPSSYFSKII